MSDNNKNEEFRRGKLRELIAADGGHAKFVEKHELSQSQASYLSQIVNGYSFGEKSAEKWRRLLKLPSGFFDVTPVSQAYPVVNQGDSSSVVAALTEEQQQMISLLSNMDKDARDALLTMGKLLAKRPSDRRKKDVGHNPERRIGPYIPPDPHDTRLYEHDPIDEIEQPKERKRR